MNHLNSLIVEGIIVKQAAFSEPVQDFKVCKFPIAVHRWYKGKNGEGKEETYFLDVEAYGKLAEVCMKKGEKGCSVRVVGRIKQERWEDDGKMKSRIIVVAEHIEYKPKFESNKTAETTNSINEKDSPAQEEQLAEQALQAEQVPVEEPVF